MAQIISHLDLSILSYSSWEKMSLILKGYSWTILDVLFCTGDFIIVGLLVSLDRPSICQSQDYWFMSMHSPRQWGWVTVTGFVTGNTQLGILTQLPNCVQMKPSPNFPLTLSKYQTWFSYSDRLPWSLSGVWELCSLSSCLKVKLKTLKRQVRLCTSTEMAFKKRQKTNYSM